LDGALGQFRLVLVLAFAFLLMMVIVCVIVVIVAVFSVVALLVAAHELAVYHPAESGWHNQGEGRRWLTRQGCGLRRPAQEGDDAGDYHHGGETRGMHGSLS
jgi:hypothetical protein